MKSSEKDIGQQVSEGVTALKGLRDEILLELHLASMDAKDAWRKLAPQLAAVEKAAHGATDATRDLVNDLVQQAKAVRASIASKRPN